LLFKVLSSLPCYYIDVNYRSINTRTLVQGQMVQSTVRIDCVFPDETSGCGTGFFLDLMIEGDIYVSVIVINRHVIENENGH
jgi:hypothetical protein